MKPELDRSKARAAIEDLVSYHFSALIGEIHSEFKKDFPDDIIPEALRYRKNKSSSATTVKTAPTVRKPRNRKNASLALLDESPIVSGKRSTRFNHNYRDFFNKNNKVDRIIKEAAKDTVKVQGRYPAKKVKISSPEKSEMSSRSSSTSALSYPTSGDESEVPPPEDNMPAPSNRIVKPLQMSDFTIGGLKGRKRVPKPAEVS